MSSSNRHESRPLPDLLTTVTAVVARPPGATPDPAEARTPARTPPRSDAQPPRQHRDHPARSPFRLPQEFDQHCLREQPFPVKVVRAWELSVCGPAPDAALGHAKVLRCLLRCEWRTVRV